MVTMPSKTGTIFLHCALSTTQVHQRVSLARDKFVVSFIARKGLRVGTVQEYCFPFGAPNAFRQDSTPYSHRNAPTATLTRNLKNLLSSSKQHNTGRPARPVLA